MEIKSLIIGIAMSLGVFAVKTGIGQYYCIAQLSCDPILFLRSSSANKWKTSGFLFTLNSAYFAIFVLSYILIIKINFLNYFNELKAFFKSGMTIHIIMAVFMFYFGWKLIKDAQNQSRNQSRIPILLLVLPCPVCSSAIFLTTAFMVNMFPERIFYSFALSWGIFFAITAITFLILQLRKSQKNLNSFIGELMLLISLYFFFNVAVAPNFKDMTKIFRIAKYEGDKIISSENNLWMYALIAFAFFAGIILKKIKTKGTTDEIYEKKTA